MRYLSRADEMYKIKDLYVNVHDFTVAAGFRYQERIRMLCNRAGTGRDGRRTRNGGKKRSVKGCGERKEVKEKRERPGAGGERVI